MNSFRWVCVALGLAGWLSGCGPAKRGVDWDGNRLQVVDIHLHPGDWNAIPEATRRFLASRFPFPIGLNAESAAQGTLSPEGILAEMDKGGVSGAVLYAVYSPRTVGIASNELVLDGLAKDPVRLRGLASLRIDKWRSATEGKDAELARLRTALAQPGMVGIKLAHAHMNFRMDDPEYFGIYEVAAALDKPVYLHTGTSPFPGTAREPPYTDPAYLESAIRQYPKTKFILGHLGYDFENKQHAALETCIRLAKTYANVFLEPSAFGSAGSDPTRENLRIAMGRMREAGVTGRIIYGSDGPQSPGFVKDYLSRTVQAMRDTGYTEAEARAVLSENYARVFGVALPPL
jgi:predicted TIM-barrel fold metal-dependent hydrolase